MRVEAATGSRYYAILRGNKELPEVIKEAIDLLEKFERESDDRKRIRMFEEAIDIFNEYMTDNPGSSYQARISNLKKTYTRILLERLPDWDDWDHLDGLPIAANYSNALRKVSDEIEANIDKRQDLRENYCRFVNGEESFMAWLNRILY